MGEKFYVYILFSPAIDSYYVGHTNDIERRLIEHNDSLEDREKYRVKNGPWILKYCESDFETRMVVMKTDNRSKLGRAIK